MNYEISPMLEEAFVAGRKGMVPEIECLRRIEKVVIEMREHHASEVEKAVKQERTRCWGVVVDLWELVSKGPRGEIQTPFYDAMKKISQTSNPTPTGESGEGV
jgi:exosome complex RNA-binding protein Rrp42 (RNase PH superfamily)